MLVKKNLTPFIDLKSQRDRIAQDVAQAIERVVTHAEFVSGPEVSELERQLGSRACGVNAIACSSGTDALVLALMAMEIAPNDVVFVPSFTFVATVEAVVLLGATPFFCDVSNDTFNLCPHSLELAIDECFKRGLGTPRAVISADLFGQPANYAALRRITEQHDLFLIADAAQSFGAVSSEGPVGDLAAITTTSFYPAKPLGCYGDGGAVFVRDGSTASTIRSLREHGQGQSRYHNERVGLNGRMDTIQAAVLLEKLKIFNDELRSRAEIAARYSSLLSGAVETPILAEGNTSTWAQYTVRVNQRDWLKASLADKGLPTAVYYPIPIHHQLPYQDYPVVSAGLSVSDALAQSVLSLPMHPYISVAVQDRLCELFLEQVEVSKCL